MTFKKGWLERQLQTASNSVGSWSTTKREALTLNREGYTCVAPSITKETSSGQKKTA